MTLLKGVGALGLHQPSVQGCKGALSAANTSSRPTSFVHCHSSAFQRQLLIKRLYAKSGDLFESALKASDAKATKEQENIVKPRIPAPHPKRDPKKMRSKYKKANFLESVAHKRKVPTSMKKVWGEARAVSGLPVARALNFLEVYPTRSAKHLLSAVKQARNNAVWRGFRAEDLEVCT